MFELNRKPPQDKSDSEQDATRRFFEEASSLSRGESGRSTKRPVQEIAFNSNAELFPATTEPQVKPRARFTSGWEGTGWEEVVRPPYVTIPYRRYKIDENETGWRGWLISGEEYTGEFKVLFVGSSNLYMPLPSGSEIKTLDKGKFEITTPDGTVITGESDGKYHHQLRKTHKDGKVETINETGRRTTIQDGITTSEERYSDGNWIRTTVELPNGRKTITETTKTSWQDQTIKRTELDEHGKEVSRTEVGQIRKPYIGNNLQRIGELVI